MWTRLAGGVWSDVLDGLVRTACKQAFGGCGPFRWPSSGDGLGRSQAWMPHFRAAPGWVRDPRQVREPSTLMFFVHCKRLPATGQDGPLGASLKPRKPF